MFGLSQIPRSIIKSVVKSAGYSIKKDPAPLQRDVWNTGGNEAVLISYLQTPFIEGLNERHTNRLECYTAAEIFRDLGYRVDVIDYNSPREIDYSGYDVIYGFGEALEKSFYRASPSASGGPLKIFYGTGCNPTFSNTESALRVAAARSRTGLWAPESGHFQEFAWRLQTLASDVVIALGDEFVLETYKREGGDCKYRRLNAFYFDVGATNVWQKNIESAKNHLLWFGSSGAIHKGLDLAIGAVVARPPLHLHICGLSIHETSFRDHYLSVLNSEFITDHGFIDIRSRQFKDLMLQCGGALFPSTSEGGSPALLNVMAAGGLVPIIPVSVGIDLEGNEIRIDDLTLEAVGEVIDCYSHASVEELKEKSIIIQNLVRDRYSYKEYRSNLASILTECVELAGSRRSGKC